MPRDPRAAATSHAPKQRPPTATTPGPKGLYHGTTPGLQVPLRYQLGLEGQGQGPRMTLGSRNQPGPATQL
eukprot:11178709-Lingulodinium_polyedra.AAC.1